MFINGDLPGLRVGDVFDAPSDINLPFIAGGIIPKELCSNITVSLMHIIGWEKPLVLIGTATYMPFPWIACQRSGCKLLAYPQKQGE